MPLDWSRREWFSKEWDSADPEMVKEWAAEICREVERICRSEALQDQKLLRKLLRTIVAATMAAAPHKETTLGTEVWGKLPDQAGVRVNVRRLRSRLDRYYNNEEADPNVVIKIEIPVGRYAARVTIFDWPSFPALLKMPYGYDVPKRDVMIHRGEVLPTDEFRNKYGWALSLVPELNPKKASRKKKLPPKIETSR